MAPSCTSRPLVGSSGQHRPTHSPRPVQSRTKSAPCQRTAAAAARARAAAAAWAAEPCQRWVDRGAQAATAVGPRQGG
eukprot:scaffold77095_cov45-Phaeocystis_antarctica.AAC.1